MLQNNFKSIVYDPYIGVRRYGGHIGGHVQYFDILKCFIMTKFY